MKEQKKEISAFFAIALIVNILPALVKESLENFNANVITGIILIYNIFLMLKKSPQKIEVNENNQVFF